ncbi:thymidylate synthase [Mycobacteroides abscessus]|uniref:thymidylate synthase n=1 Tax=Mycobacteroides abscessus TaxID=36809 RepID=UPI00037EA704|nr:thymidylate synthase [Mycobacteroides abscessus]MDO2969900.1 thymidylate synthase [Mycobacteroides abscessus subsp. bolletii]MDO3079902.1 thymidylate synthase [Mycobacteroides abscessus subsp. bolletii]SKK68315.1 thymidylate synthase, ThyA [Mycobacteroides abscessus subsp. bolletii]
MAITVTVARHAERRAATQHVGCDSGDVAMAFTEATIDDLLRVVYEAIRDGGQPVLSNRPPSHELIGVSLELTAPRCRLSRTETRRRSLAGIAELGWYLSGTTDSSMIVHWVSRYGDEVEEDGTIRGAYGPRMFGTGKNAQFETVLRLLTDSSSSRRAVIQLFDASDLAGPVRYKDVPCTSTLQFFLRDSRLHLIVTMRSNDAYVGLPLDVFAFTMLQELMAGELGVEMGRYIHNVGSLHIYDSNTNEIDDFLDEGWQSTDTPMPAMPARSLTSHVPEFLATEQQIREGVPFADVSLPADQYWADLARMLALTAARRRDEVDDDEVAAIKSSIASPFFSEFLRRD